MIKDSGSPFSSKRDPMVKMLVRQQMAKTESLRRMHSMVNNNSKPCFTSVDMIHSQQLSKSFSPERLRVSPTRLLDNSSFSDRITSASPLISSPPRRRTTPREECTVSELLYRSCTNTTLYYTVSLNPAVEQLTDWKNQFNDQLFRVQEELLTYLLHRHVSNEEMSLLIRNTFSDFKLSISELLTTMSVLMKKLIKRSKKLVQNSDLYWQTIVLDLNNQLEHLSRGKATEEERRKELEKEVKRLNAKIHLMKTENVKPHPDDYPNLVASLPQRRPEPRPKEPLFTRITKSQEARNTPPRNRPVEPSPKKTVTPKKPSTVVRGKKTALQQEADKKILEDYQKEEEEARRIEEARREELRQVEEQEERKREEERLKQQEEEEKQRIEAQKQEEERKKMESDIKTSLTISSPNANSPPMSAAERIRQRRQRSDTPDSPATPNNTPVTPISPIAPLTDSPVTRDRDGESPLDRRRRLKKQREEELLNNSFGSHPSSPAAFSPTIASDTQVEPSETSSVTSSDETGTVDRRQKIRERLMNRRAAELSGGESDTDSVTSDDGYSSAAERIRNRIKNRKNQQGL